MLFQIKNYYVCFGYEMMYAMMCSRLKLYVMAYYNALAHVKFVIGVHLTRRMTESIKCSHVFISMIKSSNVNCVIINQ